MKNYLGALRRAEMVAETYTYYEVEGNPYGVESEGSRICAYHGPGGRKCAIGRYDTHKVLKGVKGSVLRESIRDLLPKIFGVESLSESDIRFLGDLQGCHDNATMGYTSLEEELVGLRHSYRLPTPAGGWPWA